MEVGESFGGEVVVEIGSEQGAVDAALLQLAIEIDGLLFRRGCREIASTTGAARWAMVVAALTAS